MPERATLIRPRLPLRLGLSLRCLRHGPRDARVRLRPDGVWLATHTPDGPATVHLTSDGSGELSVSAWGPGAERAIDAAPGLTGCRDDLEGWEPARHPVVRELDRRLTGLRMIASGAVMESLVPSILEQKVTSHEAHTTWGRILWAWGQPAPGPPGLRVGPAPERLAAEPYHAYHRFGLERRRADVIRAVAARADRVEEAATLPRPQARARLEAFNGVGPWTSAEVAAVAWGDADAVSVGDYHLPGTVVYALTGRRGGDDDAMLELLEPFRPHRGRAARLLELGAEPQPRRHPRARLRDIRAI